MSQLTLQPTHDTPGPSLAATAPAASPNSPSSARLHTALDLHAQLHARLEHSSIALFTRQRAGQLARDKEGERELREQETSDQRRKRDHNRAQRIQQLRIQVDELRARKAVRDRAVEALDRSHLVTEHMVAYSTTDEPTKAEAETQALLTRRDSLAVQLLRLQNANAATASERSKLRKALMVRNRENAGLTQELRAIREPAEELVARLPKEVQEHYAGLQDSLLTTLSRLSVIRNVFQRLVAESGVAFFSPSALPSSSSSTAVEELLNEEEAEDAPLDAHRLLRLMLEAADSPLYDSLSSGGGGRGGGGAEGLEEGQELPEELRGVMERWRMEEKTKKRERGEERAKRTRTV
ncbi:hypothetical protein JCM8097_003888 [Rhodosporidiobolus ruineniae]